MQRFSSLFPRRLADFFIRSTPLNPGPMTKDSRGRKAAGDPDDFDHLAASPAALAAGCHRCGRPDINVQSWNIVRGPPTEADGLFCGCQPRFGSCVQVAITRYLCTFKRVSHDDTLMAIHSSLPEDGGRLGSVSRRTITTKWGNSFARSRFAAV